MNVGSFAKCKLKPSRNVFQTMFPTDGWYSLYHHVFHNLSPSPHCCLSMTEPFNDAQLQQIMILSPVTNNPVYLWAIPNVCFSRIPQHSQPFGALLQADWNMLLASNPEQAHIYKTQREWWVKTNHISFHCFPLTICLNRISKWSHSVLCLLYKVSKHRRIENSGSLQIMRFFIFQKCKVNINTLPNCLLFKSQAGNFLKAILSYNKQMRGRRDGVMTDLLSSLLEWSRWVGCCIGRLFSKREYTTQR